MALKSNKESNKKLFLRYLSENEGVSLAKLAKQILKENKSINLSDRHIQRCLSNLKKSIEGDLEIKVEEDEPKYTVSEGIFYIPSKKKVLQLSVEFIDNLFYEYSEKGLNLTQTQIINKHGLEVFEWNSIKSRLDLYKKSNIFSPYTVSITPPEELETMITEKLDKLFQNVPFQIEKKYEQSLLKQNKKLLENLSEKKVIIQTIITELVDLLPSVEINIVETPEVEGKSTAISVFVSDIHYGAETKENLIPLIGEYNPQVSERKLMKIASIVNSLKKSEVNVFFVGDIIESFSGMNHKDSFKGIAKGFYGSKIIFSAYECLLKFLSAINNLTTVHAVAGNHDRVSDDNTKEQEGWAGELIFKMISLSLKDTPVYFDERVISHIVEGVCVVMTHGDKKITDASPSDLVLEFGKQGLYHLLVSGHWHERRIKSDRKHLRHVVCPSIFPGNDFSVNLGHIGSNPGFLTAENNGEGKINLTDYSI